MSLHPIVTDNQSLRQLAVSEFLNIPKGTNLDDPLLARPKARDGNLAFDEATGFLYIGVNGVWHLAPGGSGGNSCDVNVPCTCYL